MFIYQANMKECKLIKCDIFLSLVYIEAGSEPGLMFFKAVAALVSWKSSANTFLAFLVSTFPYTI